MPVQIACVICGISFSVRPSRIAKGAKYCNYKCHQIGEGRKGGKIRAVQMQAASQGRAYTKMFGRHTHRVIAEQKIGRALMDGEVVHHIDGNFLNNHPDNLQVLPSQADHLRVHIREMLAARKRKHNY